MSNAIDIKQMIADAKREALRAVAEGGHTGTVTVGRFMVMAAPWMRRDGRQCWTMHYFMDDGDGYGFNVVPYGHIKGQAAQEVVA